MQRANWRERLSEASFLTAAGTGILIVTIVAVIMWTIGGLAFLWRAAWPLWLLLAAFLMYRALA